MSRAFTACLVMLSVAGLALAPGAGGAAAAEAGHYQNLPLSVAPGQAAPKGDPASIPDAEYVRATPDGRLECRGQRIRFWAVIGSFPNLPGQAATPGEPPRNYYEENEAFIARFQDLGFNLNRMWHPRSEETLEDYTPGDGSPADVLDHFIATAKARDFRFWSAGLGAARNRGKATAEDAGIVDDPATAEAWKAWVAETPGGVGLDSVRLARAWDRRLEAIGIREMKRVADHVNHYTGLRVADDPVYAAFELSNEEWWMRRMVGGGWLKYPDFLRRELIEQWNAFLKSKYGTTEKLTAAWEKLLPGEDLAKGNVALAPMAEKAKIDLLVNDASVATAAAAAAGVEGEISRQDLAPQRAADVLEFLLQVQLEHKKREADAVKSWGKAMRLCPLAWDTGIGYEIQSQYLHQQADVVAHDAYVNGRYGARMADAQPPEGADELMLLQHKLSVSRMTDNRGKWTDWLEKPPGISQGVPWLEHNKVEGKPYFVYETQIQQPAKYRADFPLRLAALAAVQDWDAVCWHYWGSAGDIGTDPRPFDKPMDVTTGSHPQGYHYTFDEVQNAMMRAAGLTFRNGAYPPADRPTKFIYGRKALYEPESMRYAGSYGMTGMDMLPTTYQYGVRIQIDPAREETEVIGPVVKGADYFTHNPYTPTPEITFDWKKGYLVMDSPSAVAWTGLLAQYGSDQVRFANGATLSDVKIVNPEGIYDPVGDDEKYVAFALYSEDGKPLAETKKACLSLVSTSFNTGFKLGGDEGAKSTVRGDLPVLVARVGATVACPALAGMKYTLRDWHMEPIGEGTVEGGTLVIPAEKSVWVVELTR